MDASLPNLHVLDKTSVTKELDLVSELFHCINRIIPDDQHALTISPDCTVREAVELMRKHGYSQVPVIQGEKVLGVFSYRSFAEETADTTLEEMKQQRFSPGDLRVDEFLEQFQFARVSDEISRVFDSMDRDAGVLVGTPDLLIGILTPMDFLKYLYQVASPFVMVSEIELALRALIRISLDELQIKEAAKLSLKSTCGTESKIPTKLEEMTFDNYQTLIGNNTNWPNFEPIFGCIRNRTIAKLKQVGSIRNDIFHFKREITIEDHETLSNHRNWLLSKIKQSDAHLATEMEEEA